ncbi:glycine zipper family protein [Simiduia aestuariiviva]|uniref:Sugar (Pentulose or hexulose) kinase n=1 Tax=Simiduia aestuariiviva TaxID=1510459 RepID=A0A839URC0_9GAMM|nr:glycine zipper family protein [Simiduia aestuariiviva]MBB3167925.1 sugar (pentulose or hexulose) kinase [Simiduia aestuariiviva]
MNTRLKLLAVGLSLLALSGCARNKPIVDTQGIDMVQYRQDLGECRAYAQEVNTGGKVAGGAAAGAVVGGAIGAVLNGTKGAQRGAGAGAVTGAARGAASGRQEKQQVVKNCLRGRGYRVLN